MSENILRVGLAGLGTVGAGVIKLLETNRDIITRRAGKDIRVTAVSARDRSRNRGIDIAALGWEDNAVNLASRADVDTVVELIGGSDGPALALARASLAAKKGFVTANKAMLAHHGLDLSVRAEKADVALKYEAAVGGGIPVIKGIREGLAANDVTQVYGILNGTCNYILSVMEREGRSFDAVLGDAQALGYAESDPSFDVDGIDAAHKLSILATLGFGTQPDFASVAISGIRQVAPVDIRHAKTLGYRLKLVGMAQKTGAGLMQRVATTLVPLTHPLAHVGDSLNAVVAEGNFVGRLLFQGRGAGEGPTASAVVADLIDVARGEWGPPFAMPAASLDTSRAADATNHEGRFYLRLRVMDKPGVLAHVTAALRDAAVSVESLIQLGEEAEGPVHFVLTTHKTQERAMRTALAHIATFDFMAEAPVLFHIMDS
jgi:homoserine dehydrogenase